MSFSIVVGNDRICYGGDDNHIAACQDVQGMGSARGTNTI